MHELSIAEALVQQVQSIASDQNAKVTGVTVSIGALSGVDSVALNQAFRIAAEDSPFRDAELFIEHVPARVFCHACNRESSPDFPLFACQDCGSLDFEIISGRDMLLKSLKLST